jgi:hypothetical protein
MCCRCNARLSRADALNHEHQSSYAAPEVKALWVVLPELSAHANELDDVGVRQVVHDVELLDCVSAQQRLEIRGGEKRHLLAEQLHENRVHV